MRRIVDRAPSVFADAAYHTSEVHELERAVEAASALPRLLSETAEFEIIAQLQFNRPS